MPIYFVDSLEGNDDQDGLSDATSWQTLGRLSNHTLQPGDAAKLKRGSTWAESLHIAESGAPGGAITVLPYGAGEAPIISRPGSLTPAVMLDGERIVFMQIHVDDAGGFGIRVRGKHVAVRQCEISRVGLGVGLQARACAVTNCYIHDLRVVESGEGGPQDYGAVGVDCNAEWAEIAQNRFVNCICDTVEWGLDGGIVELKGDVDHSWLHHNLAVNCFGMFEVGGYPGHCHEVRIEDNLAVDCYQLGGWHLGGDYASDVYHFQFRRNAYLDTQDNPAEVMWFHEGEPNAETVIMEENSFVVSSTSLRSMARGEGFTHRHNRYALKNVNFNLALHNTELLEYIS